MWCCGYIPSVSQNPICCLAFLLLGPRIAKSEMDDGEGNGKEKERDQYEDKACRTFLEMNRGKRERMMEETGWFCRLDESGDERQRKSTYDTQSLRHITLSSYWAITLPRAMISVRARRCVCEKERKKERRSLGFLSPETLAKREICAFKTQHF